jgi:hypothetical protein
MVKKITINKSDEVAVVVEKIIDTDATEIVLNIPRFSHLAESLSNFHLLKREVESLGKNISIESVDDRVIELAEMSGLKAVNPFFVKNKNQFSDILAPQVKSKRFKLKSGLSSRRSGVWPREDGQLKKNEEEAESSSMEIPVLQEETAALPKKSFWRVLKLPKFPNFIRNFPWKFLGILFLTGVIVWVLLQELPRATIVIHAKKADWSYNNSIITEKLAKADPQNLTLPNQIFIQKKNLELRFPATGKKQVERFAVGKVTVYNSYSSEPQPLVVKTRFLSPEGKVFLLTKGITVPGAKIVDGKIIPSSIEADVIAEKPGSEYNIGPVKLFTIPGFKGSPRYQAFYGESKEAMTGGFIGEVAYPTDSDLNAAKATAAKNLEDSLRVAIYSQLPEGFKVLDDAVNFKILKQTVNETVDETGKFSLFTDAQMTLISFKEEDLYKILTKKAEEEIGLDFEVISKELKYGLARANYQTGQMSFLVDFKAQLRHKVDLESLRNRIAGRPEVDLKAVIFSLSGIENANISLWPFWVNKVPANQKKIRIIID